MSQIPYYDSADGKLLNYVSDAVAQRYLTDGTAHAVRQHDGRIARLYRRMPSERVHTAGFATAHLDKPDLDQMRRKDPDRYAALWRGTISARTGRGALGRIGIDRSMAVAK